MPAKEQKAMPTIDILNGLSEGIAEEFPDGTQEEIISPEAVADLEHSEAIETTVPKERVVWWKVYKLVGTPGGTSKRVFKTEIMDVSQIKDAELHVRDLAIERGWGSWRLCYYETFPNEPRHQSLVLSFPGVKVRRFFSFCLLLIL